MPSAAPLFVISFRQRDELANAVGRGGWQPIAARRLANAAERFILSQAGIALVDARGACDEGLEAVRILADPVEANAAALIVLISKTDIPSVEDFFDAGATHYLASPFGDEELLNALRFAGRHAERLAHSFGHERRPLDDALEWRLDEGTVTLGTRAAEILGIEDTVAEQYWLAALGDAAADAERTIAKVRNSGEPRVFAHRIRGERIVHHLSLVEGAVSGRIELPQAEASPRSAVHRDPLTGLANARGVRRWIEARLGESDREPLVLLLVGLSRIGTINAAQGHEAGDALLRRAARKIEDVMVAQPSGDRLLARLSGGQFAVGLAPHVEADEAVRLARQLIEGIAGDAPGGVPARCGIYTAERSDDPATVIRNASMALANAERDSSPVTFYAPGDGAAFAERTRLEHELGPAIARGEIEIVYQPQIAVAAGNVVGVEGLARWRHPELGEIGAEALFAAADRADQLLALSHHIQKKALATAARWTGAMAALRVAINVTAGELAESDFTNRMLELPSETGFPIERLTIEVTESGLVTDLAEAAERLAALRSSGMRIAIDDFGTGYSSLAYLKSLPLDYLKLDKSFSVDAEGGPRDRVIVSGVIEMARSLGLSVIAEGVETEAQLAFLAEQRCALYQGYLCSPPVDETALKTLIDAQTG